MDLNGELTQDEAISENEETKPIVAKRESAVLEIKAASETDDGTNSENENQYHDRIAEAYEGLLGEDFMNRQKVRIDWICRKAESGRILDIGCSQGTCPLLLGRSGAEVTGIDIDPEAIRYATGHLLEEPVEVQSRVRYLCADFLSVELPENHYDAVLLTEILEHLEDPQSFLNKAVLLLRDGGRLVVTVPFGVNAFKDHKRTYYLSELYGQLSALTTITDIEFFDGWVGFLTRKNAEDAIAVPTSVGLIANEEKAFYEIEEKYRSREKTLRADLRQMKQSRQNYGEKVLNLAAELKSRKETQAAMKAEVADLKKKLASLETTLQNREAALATANTVLDERETALAAANAALDEKKAALVTANTALDENETALANANTALCEKEAALATANTALDEKEAALATANTALDEKEAALATANTALDEKEAALATANTALDEKEAALAAANTALDEREAALATANTALDEKEAVLATVHVALNEREAVLAAANAALLEKDAALHTATDELEQKRAEIGQLQTSLKDSGNALRTVEETVNIQNNALVEVREKLKTALGKLKKTENTVLSQEKTLKENEDKLRLAEKREAQLKEKYGEYSSELYQTRRKLELANKEKNELLTQLSAVKGEYDELMETPAGHRAYLKLLRAKFRKKRKVEKAEKKTYEGGALRRAAKKIPFLVAIVKRIRRKHPGSEFLYLEASRSEFQVNEAKRFHTSSGNKPSASSVGKKPKATGSTAKEKEPALPPQTNSADSKSIKVETEAKPQEKIEEIAAKPTPQKMSKEQEQFIDRLLPMINALPESNGCRYYERSRLKIGIICDEFLYDSIKSAAEFVPLEPKNWREILPSLNVLLIVSLWHGLHDEWTGAANPRNLRRRQVILDMIAESKHLGIPTVFYSKEDPPNYERYVDFAKECDYVFTTAEECIPDYVRDTGNPRANVLRFSINPLFHNPVGFRKFEKENAVLFSGSWMSKYPERCQDMSMLFDGVLDSGYELHIIDRNYPANSAYPFPPQYFPYVSPAVDHTTLQKVHKLFDWAINTNSVQFSKTMFANRAYELQAAGVLLLSNYSLGVNSLLPNVFMAFSSEEAKAILRAYTPEETYERQIAGIRSVMRSDTCFERMDELFEAIGFERQQKVRRIAVIGNPADPTTAASFARQTFQDRMLLIPAEVTEDALAEYDMVAFFGPGIYYGEFYLEDMANGFKYTACDYITKDSYIEGGVLHPGTEHDYVNVMGSRYRTLFWREAFTAETLLSLQDRAELPNGYSIDHFNYDAAPVKKNAERTEPYKLSVVVPVYNNGPHLYGKCFSSLRRSSIFQDMEIILVDDGSTDGVTPQYVSYLASRYDNISTFFFEKGGSGSASRPRNKGVQMATAEYLTFLDPDNEACEDAYAQLLASTEGGKYELAVGGHLRAGLAIDKFSSYRSFSGRFGSDTVIEKIPNIVNRMKFPTISIQASVIQKKLITKNGLEQVPGAAGQDTLFGWQLLDAANSQRFLPITAHIYYAATSGSVTNTITVNFFRKLWLLQEPKLSWLQSSGNLEPFMKNKYAYYTDQLVLKKLASVRAGDEDEAIRIVWDYLQLYAPYFQGRDEMIERFSALCDSGKFREALDYVKGSFASPEQTEKNG